MNRQRILKQRAARNACLVIPMDGRWAAVSGRGWGYVSDYMSKREAVQLAARLAMPAKKVEIVVTQ